MTGSMYAAIAGLRTHMQNLNVIGNNVANVNTQSYKSARSVFKTSIYTTLSGGSDGTAVVGGANPSQIGYGASMASVDIDMSTGNFAVTGNPTDMMIDGDGFFLMANKDVAATFNGDVGDVNKLTSMTLTRLGNFAFKADGYLTNDDLCVYGFMCTGVATGADVAAAKAENPNSTLKEGDPIFSDQLVPIRYPGVRMVVKYYDANGLEVPVPDDAEIDQTTGLPNVEGVVEARRVPEIVYASDSVTTGTGADATTSYKPLEDAYHYVDADGNEWPRNEDGSLADGVDGAEPIKTYYPKAQFNGITVDKATGLIYGISNDTNEVVYIGCIAIGQVTNPNGVTQIGDSYYTAGPGSGDLTISVIGGGASSLGIEYVNRSLTLMNAAAGGEDDNNEEGEPAYIDGLRIRSGGKTGLQTNGLEMSKTDLAQEIANMILTQRGYQANTRIITVTDSMLEELVNMKR